MTSDNTKYFYVENGFLEIRENELTILAEIALKKDELIKDEIKERIEEYKQKRKTTLGGDELLIIDFEIKNLKSKLKISSR